MGRMAELKKQMVQCHKSSKYFRTCQALGAADIDGWRGREHVLYLFTNNDTELHQLILDELILPSVMGELLPQFLPELAGGLLFVFLQERWRSSPSLCGSMRRCAARLTSDCTRDVAHTYFTTTYPNFMQYAGGLQDGATRCAQLLNMLLHQHRHQGGFSGNVPDRPPLTCSRARLQRHMIMGRCSLGMTSQPLKS